MEAGRSHGLWGLRVRVGEQLQMASQLCKPRLRASRDCRKHLCVPTTPNGVWMLRAKGS